MKMTNCENCYHYNVCSGRPDVETYGCKCDDYKDKSSIIEIPCKIGDKVYRINESITPVFDNEMNFIHYEHCCYVTESILKRSDISINEVYLTKEEAERFKEYPTQARDLHRIPI